MIRPKLWGLSGPSGLSGLSGLLLGVLALLGTSRAQDDADPVAAPASANPALARRPELLPRAEAGRWKDFYAERAPSSPPPATTPELMARALQAERAYLARDYPAAVERAYAALELGPDFPPTLMVLGTTYFRLRRYDDARACLERFVEIAPDQIGKTQALGHCYYSLGDYERALAHYGRVLAANPGSPEAVRGEALSNMRLGRFEEALAGLARVLELAPEHADAQYWRAQVLYELGRADEALEAALRAQELDRFEPRAAYLLARVYAELGRDGEADAARRRWSELSRLAQEVRSLESKLLLSPPDAYALATRLVELHRASGNGKGLRAAVAQVLRHFPDEVDEEKLFLQLFEAIVAVDGVHGAGDVAEALGRRFPTSANVWRRLEAFYGALGDVQKQIHAGELWRRLGSSQE